MADGVVYSKRNPYLWLSRSMDFNDEELYQVADIYNHYVLNDICTFEVRQQRKTISWKTRITSLLICPPLFLFPRITFSD